MAFLQKIHALNLAFGRVFVELTTRSVFPALDYGARKDRDENLFRQTARSQTRLVRY